LGLRFGCVTLEVSPELKGRRIDMPPIDGTPLDSLPQLPKPVTTALKASWITTAEQLVASTAAMGGPEVMARHLGIGVTEFRRVLEAAEAAIPAAERARLKSPTDTRNYGLGALPQDLPD
jgi:hypothetical protein